MTQANLILDIDKTEPKPARHSYSTTHDNTVSNLDTKPSIKIAKTNTKNEGPERHERDYSVFFWYHRDVFYFILSIEENFLHHLEKRD